MDGGDFQIAEKGEGKGAGYGGCGHQQQVGGRSLLNQLSPLFHTKLVLFVNNYKAQSGEDHIFGKQRVGTDQQIYLSGFQRLQERPAGALVDITAQKGHSYPQRLQQGSRLFGMLAGQQLGGCQKGDLIAGFDHRQS